MNIRYKNQKNIDVKNTRKPRFSPFFGPQNSGPILFSKGKIKYEFFTEDSGLYITPRQSELLRKKVLLNQNIKNWDSLSSRIVQGFVYCKPKETAVLLDALEKRYSLLNDSINNVSKGFFGHLSLARAWNLSIVGSILFGMMMMTFVYRYLGQGASAQQAVYVNTAQNEQTAQKGKVLGAEFGNDDVEEFTRQYLEIEKIENEQALEKEIRKMVKGYPIEKMAPFIAKKDRKVAAFIVSIAKKESDWGKHVPVLNGQDCYNYWGYRGIRKRMGTGGHTCFDSPQDAVDTVAKRIQTLVEKHGNTTPAKMVEPWKCGYDCEATGGRAAANKWISDVAKYFNELDEKK
ncbi:MAG TPA: hypothetical protein PLB52_03815 [Candidatus Moranbacteria bacterium]|nr:hypothetical protein [Candidatus Moranbacteria bacterium]